MTFSPKQLPIPPHHVETSRMRNEEMEIIITREVGPGAVPTELFVWASCVGAVLHFQVDATTFDNEHTLASAIYTQVKNTAAEVLAIEKSLVVTERKHALN